MAGETPETTAAGQPKPANASQAKKRKADDVESPPAPSPPPAAKKAKTAKSADLPPLAPKPAETAEPATAAPAAKKTASRPPKRKPADSDPDTPAPAAKKAKKGTAKVAKPRGRRTNKTAPASDAPIQQAPQPAEVSAPAQAKIDAVKAFLATEMKRSGSLLERDGILVSIPELDLVGVVMTLHFHYQLDNAETYASLDDVWDAVTARFRRPVVKSGEDVEWLTLDLSIPTPLEKSIKEKIAYHGLEDANLLEVEMEMCASRNRAQARRPLGRDDWGLDLLMEETNAGGKGLWRELCDEGWYGAGEVARKVDAGRMRGVDEVESGRKGVCPKAMWEVV